jgi:hypothetical protein
MAISSAAKAIDLHPSPEPVKGRAVGTSSWFDKLTTGSETTAVPKVAVASLCAVIFKSLHIRPNWPCRDISVPLRTPIVKRNRVMAREQSFGTEHPL